MLSTSRLCLAQHSTGLGLIEGQSAERFPLATKTSHVCREQQKSSCSGRALHGQTLPWVPSTSMLSSPWICPVNTSRSSQACDAAEGEWYHGGAPGGCDLPSPFPICRDHCAPPLLVTFNGREQDGNLDPPLLSNSRVDRAVQSPQSPQGRMCAAAVTHSRGNHLTAREKQGLSSGAGLHGFL